MINKIKIAGNTFLLLIVVISCCCCHNYYKTTRVQNNRPGEVAGSIDSLENKQRYFILRAGSLAFQMKNISLSPDQKTISCVLDSVSYLHQLHFSNGRKGKMRYSKHRLQEAAVLNEVHLFMTDSAVAAGSYTLTLDKIEKIEVIEKDKKRTTNSYVIGAIGYSLGAAAVVAIIIAATKSSCPFVSAYDGNDFTLQGEIYGGAIYPQLARHDYLLLKMAPVQKEVVQIKITNELKERQYTDMADLLVITHDKNLKVLAAENGALFSIGDPKAPVAATLNNNKNVLPAVMSAGDNALLYMDDSSATDARNEVTVRFDRPAGTQGGKLILSLKNSYWLDLLYGELAKGFGTYYASYLQQQKNKPAEELQRWVKEQQIPLTISLKVNDRWQRVTEITTFGPLAMREIVVPVDWPESSDSLVDIKLAAGFMFWEVDRIAMDFTPGNNFTVQKLSPFAAEDETGKNVLAGLQKEDGIYLEQPNIGNVATLSYKIGTGKSPDQVQTFILHARGYYEHIRDFKHPPDIKFLSQFKKPNAFPVYGMHLYKKVKAEAISSLAGTH